MNIAGIGLRNAWRNKTRAILTILGGAVAVLAFVLLRTVLSAWSVGIDYAAKDRLATRHKISIILTLPKRYIDIVRQVPGVKQATYMNWFGGKDPRRPNEFFANFAVDPVSFLDVFDEMIVSPEDRTRWLEDRRGALVGDVLARKLGVKVGDRVTLAGTIFPGDWEFDVSGIYQAARKSLDRSQFVFHWGYLNESIPERARDQIGWIATRIDSPNRAAEISQAIDKTFDEKDIQTVTMSERAMGVSFMAGLSAILTALDIVSFIILLIMTLILGNTLAMGVRERTHEYGVLRAIGFRTGHVVAFVLGEGLAIGLLAGAVGVGLSYPIVQVGMGRWLEENVGSIFPYFRVDATTAALALGLSMGLGALASVVPALQASRLTVVDALRRLG